MAPLGNPEVGSFDGDFDEQYCTRTLGKRGSSPYRETGGRGSLVGTLIVM